MDGIDRSANGKKSEANDLMVRGLRCLDPRSLIESLESEHRTRFRGLILVVAMLGMGRVKVISCRRSLQEQQVIWGRGRTIADCRRAGVPEIHASPDEAKVTWAAPRLSKHVGGLALDLDVSMYEQENYSILGHAARSLGLDWGGDWRVKDYGHFEVGL